jgi:hypothetical protein
MMSSSVLYRVAAVLLVVFALGHQLGFRTVDPTWNAGDVVRGMQATRFTVQGFTRTYWGFYSGFGFFVTVFLLFSAFLAWTLGRAPAATLRPLSVALWAFAICYVGIALMTWMYFFMAPGIFATLVAVCLVAAPMSIRRDAPATRATIERYFQRLEARNGWESSFDDRIAFTSYTSPRKSVEGRDNYLQATKRFYSSIANATVREYIVDGERACVLTRYSVKPPTGAPAFESDVAEIFSVKGDRITSLGIYFDTAPFSK